MLTALASPLIRAQDHPAVSPTSPAFGPGVTGLTGPPRRVPLAQPVLASSTYAVGSNPFGVVFDGTNIWVANSGSNNVTKLLASTGATLGTYPAGSGPTGMAFDGTYVWVTDQGGNSVTKMQASTGAVVGNYPAGPTPIGVAFDGSDIWVASFNGNSVTRLQASTGAIVGTYSVATTPGGSALRGVAFDGANIWVANALTTAPGGVTKLLASTGTVIATYPVGLLPAWVVSDGTNIWVTNQNSNTVTKLTASTGAIVGTYPVGLAPIGVAFDGTNIWVANSVGNSVTELAASTGATIGTYPVGLYPLGVAFDGTSIWVTNGNGNTVTRINLASAELTAALSATSLAFGGQPVGLTSAPQTVTVSNAGAVPLNVTGITLTGANSSDFNWTSTCGNPVAAGSSCTISVTFIPTATGVRTATINVTDNAVNSPQTIGLTGTGQSSVPMLTLSATSIAFGYQAVGITSAAQFVTLNNGGTAPLNIADVVIYGTNSADYSMGAYNTCRSSVAAGSSCFISITFTPTATGIRTASISITDNAPDSPQVLSLTGTGQAGAAVTLSTTSLAFGIGAVGFASNPQNVTVMNSGAAALIINGIALSGPNSTDYTLGATVCGIPVAPGSSCVIPVTFTPAANGIRTASISITDNTPNSPQTIGLTGTGQPITAPIISTGGVVPIDSTSNTIQPGEWVSIYGSKLANGTAIWDGNFTSSLGGTSVTINGRSGYLSLVSPGQINLQAPDDTAIGPVPVVVTTSGGSTTSIVTLAPFAPSFCLLDRSHVAGIILRPNGTGTSGNGSYDIIGPTGRSLGYPTVAARAGDSVALFGVGFGATSPHVPAGQTLVGPAATTNVVQLMIGGTTVVPSFSGLSGAGLYQINLTLPAGLGAGDVVLVASVGGTQSQPGVVISLQ